GRVLNEEVEKAETAVREKVKNRYGSGQSDGWKNVAKNSLITGMVNVEYKPYLLGVTDVSSKPKTAETLLEIVCQEIKHAKEVLGVLVVAWCTDCGGDAAKMRRLLQQKYPWLVCLDCWAHQFNLVTGDVLKLKISLIEVVDQASDVIKWFLNHSIPLSPLNKEQPNAGFLVVRTLILPVLTRWTSHYCSTDRLVSLKTPFLRLIADENTCRQLIKAAGSKPSRHVAEAKVQRVIDIISCQDFWRDLTSLRDLLKPFAIATNAAQADHCCMDTVLLLMGYLYHIHSYSRINARADQDIFILAVVFNPYIRNKAFRRNHSIRTIGGLWVIVSRVYKRFYDKLPDRDFRRAFTEYISGTGRWSYDGMSLRYHLDDAKAENTFVDRVNVWRELVDDPNNYDGANGMVCLAMRICSMVPNSAATERIFSRFGNVHTKTRNRMGAKKTRQIVILSNHIQGIHGAPPTYKRKR
ncbi:hypothetical protein K435DRAFT_617015, partial [Dendrothele bispora CBS 962.96]